MRTTRKQLEGLLQAIANQLGVRVGHYEKNSAGEYVTIPGGLALDHNPHYGGYVVEQIGIDGCTGTSHPFGEKRLPAGQCWDKLQGVLRGIEWGKAIANS